MQLAESDPAGVASMGESSELPETRLVAHLLAQSREPLSVATRERLAQALLDWFTAGWSALDMAAAARLRVLSEQLHGEVQPVAACAPSGTAHGHSGHATVFGGGGGPAGVLTAAFSNAAITHLREIDDAHRAAMLHPGVVAISPVLALAPSLGLSRREVAGAIIAGYEASLRLGEALGTRHAALFHATATAGSLGAAAAAGIALGLDAQRLHHALGIAATQAMGLWQLVDDDAHESKSLHPAFAVRNGLTAAFAARAGFPGARAFVTGKRGLYAALAGSGDRAVIDADLAAPARLHTATVKAWPACAQLFTALDATLALTREHGFDAGQVERIDISIFSHALKIAGVDWPNKPSETAFCLRYLIAVLILRGRITIADTESPELHWPALTALAQRIHVHSDEEFQKVFPQRRPSRVTIRLLDGRTLDAQRDLRRGDPEDPFTWTDLQARMQAFAPQIDPVIRAELIDWCWSFTDGSLDAAAGTPPARLFGVRQV